MDKKPVIWSSANRLLHIQHVMSITAVLDYLDRQGLEFSYSPEMSKIDIYQGRHLKASLVKTSSSWFLLKFKGRCQVKTMSHKNPLALISGGVI